MRQFSCYRVSPFAGRRFGEFYFGDLEGLELQGFRFQLSAIEFAGTGHGYVDVFEDAARGDAENAVGRFDEVVTFASAMLAAEVIDEAETGTELFGFDEETRAIRLPLF